MKNNELFVVPTKYSLTNKTGRARIVKPFVKDGVAYSPSGMTAGVIVDHCLRHGIGFTVEYNPLHGGSFVVTKTDIYAESSNDHT